MPRCHCARSVQQVGVRQQRTFRLAGGAGGEHQQRRVVRLRGRACAGVGTQWQLRCERYVDVDVHHSDAGRGTGSRRQQGNGRGQRGRLLAGHEHAAHFAVRQHVRELWRLREQVERHRHSPGNHGGEEQCAGGEPVGQQKSDVRARADALRREQRVQRRHVSAERAIGVLAPGFRCQQQRRTGPLVLVLGENVGEGGGGDGHDRKRRQGG